MNTYTVQITTTCVHECTLDARTPDEAAAYAESDFHDGVIMDMVSEEVESVEAIRSDDEG